jgi:3-hydroxy-9,10-secoandrosta-1,3,5(10)-triene-9,17-dione monooxygenase reductase component
VPLEKIDASEFRKTMGCYATGVTVVTTVAEDGSDVGLTVNSFNTLSLEPPLVLWSLGVGSPLLKAFQRASHFAVNVLSADQVEISQRFALRAVDKFSDLEMRAGLGGAALIGDCSAWIECRRRSSEQHGDHVLFIGEVERMASTTKKPLLYLHGRYATTG